MNKRYKTQSGNYDPTKLLFSSYVLFVCLMGLINLFDIIYGLVTGKGLILGDYIYEIESPSLITELRIILYESFIFRRPHILFICVYFLFLIRVLIRKVQAKKS